MISISIPYGIGWLLIVLGIGFAFYGFHANRYNKKNLTLYWSGKRFFSKPYLLMPLRDAAIQIIEECVRLEDRGYSEYSRIHVLASSFLVEDTRFQYAACKMIQSLDLNLYGKRPGVETLQRIDHNPSSLHLSLDASDLCHYDGRREVSFTDLMVTHRGLDEYIASMQPPRGES